MGKIRLDNEKVYKKGNFICNKCELEKPLSEFGKHKNSNKYGINSTCKECLRKEDKFIKIKRAYGIDEEDFQAMYISQNGKCAICNEDIALRSKIETKYHSACVDHCHETGKVRDLLCSDCNRGLGFFKDDVNIINNVLKYLIKHGKTGLGELQT